MAGAYLSSCIFIPFIGALFCALVSEKNNKIIKNLSSLSAFIVCGIMLYLLVGFNKDQNQLQFVEKFNWIESFQIMYSLGADGINLLLGAWISFVFAVTLSFPWQNNRLTKGFYVLMLLLLGAIVGSLFSQDLFLFITFWIISITVPYLALSVWGGDKKEQAASNYFVFQIFGSACLILAMLLIYAKASPHSFQLDELIGGKFTQVFLTVGQKNYRIEKIIFILFFIGLAVRIPLVPFHGWIAGFIKEAPIPLSILIASSFIQTGIYSIVKWAYPMFPWAANNLSWLLTLIAVSNILYGALCALAQIDLRKMISYIIVIQSGVMMLGVSIFERAAMVGGILHMISFGLTIALFTFIVGILGQRTNGFKIVLEAGRARLGGLVKIAPWISIVFTLAMIALIGVPGFMLFVTQTLVLMGSVTKHWGIGILVLLGLFMSASCLVWVYRKIFLGKASDEFNSCEDLTFVEKTHLYPLVILGVVIGVYPAPVIHFIENFVSQLLINLGNGK